MKRLIPLFLLVVVVAIVLLLPRCAGAESTRYRAILNSENKPIGYYDVKTDSVKTLEGTSEEDLVKELMKIVEATQKNCDARISQLQAAAVPALPSVPASKKAEKKPVKEAKKEEAPKAEEKSP